MSRILCVWELGVGLGHLAPLAALIDELTRRGNEVFCAVKDLSQAHIFFEDSTVTLIQAPVWLVRSNASSKTHSFADILLSRGYHSVDTLASLISAWSSLYDFVNPDLVVFDHSPTAMLAARLKNFPRVIFSTSFVTPVPGAALISLLPWEKDEEAVVSSEERVLVTINQCLDKFQASPLRYIGDIYESKLTVLHGFMELDFYQGTRSDCRYIGSLENSGTLFQKPQWKQNTSPKVFAYLRCQAAHSERILEALSQLDADVCCYYIGASSDLCAKWSDRMHISNKPFDLNLAHKAADVVVCHGGAGTVNSALQAGLPVVSAPIQLEQVHTSILVEKHCVGVSISPNDDLVNMVSRLKAVLDDSSYQENAKRFSTAYGSLDSVQSIVQVADGIEGLQLE